MKHGDVVTVAASGDYGKPRPAVIVQTDALPDDHQIALDTPTFRPGRDSAGRTATLKPAPPRVLAISV